MAYLISCRWDDRPPACWMDLALLVGSHKELQWLHDHPSPVQAAAVADVRRLLSQTGPHSRHITPHAVEEDVDLHFHQVTTAADVPGGRRLYRFQYVGETGAPVLQLLVLSPAGSHQR